MSFQTALFYIFSVVLVLAAIRVVTARNPVHAVLSLVLCFCTAGALWMLIGAEFLAIALVLVYVGAVLVLFLFVVMMLDINMDRLRQGFWSHLPAGLVVGGLVLLEMVGVLSTNYFAFGYGEVVLPKSGSNTHELGMLLYTEYIYPFEVVAILLLVAVVAAVALTLRRRGNVKTQNQGEQAKVRSQDRLRIMSNVGRAEK